MLGNIHPKYRSALKALQLVILCPVQHIKSYGMDKILQPLMADLAILESVSHDLTLYSPELPLAFYSG